MKSKTVRLIVDLRDAREVERLRSRIRDLEQHLEATTAHANRCEFDLVCQQRINLQLFDYCQEAGYRIPKRLFTIWPHESKSPL